MFMRSRSPAAVPATPDENDRREPSLGRQPSTVTRLGADGAITARPLRAGERLAVLSSSGAPEAGRQGMGLPAKIGLGVLVALALVGAVSIGRMLAGL